MVQSHQHLPGCAVIGPQPLTTSQAAYPRTGRAPSDCQFNHCFHGHGIDFGACMHFTPLHASSCCQSLINAGEAECADIDTCPGRQLSSWLLTMLCCMAFRTLAGPLGINLSELYLYGILRIIKLLSTAICSLSQQDPSCTMVNSGTQMDKHNTGRPGAAGLLMSNSCQLPLAFGQVRLPA